VAVARHALTLRLKDQRTSSHGYKLCCQQAYALYYHCLVSLLVTGLAVVALIFSVHSNNLDDFRVEGILLSGLMCQLRIIRE